MQLYQPGWIFRTFVAAGQGIFLSAFSTAYLISPRFCHRLVGYVEVCMYEQTLFLGFRYPAHRKLTSAVFLSLSLLPFFFDCRASLLPGRPERQEEAVYT